MMVSAASMASSMRWRLAVGECIGVGLLEAGESGCALLSERVVRFVEEFEADGVREWDTKEGPGCIIAR